MATSKKGKKVINQDELRRLMRERQRQTTERKRIESPFAKYNSLGHLSCVLCSVQVKSEILWQTHVLGKQHREKVSELKASSAQPQPSQPTKRKTPEAPEVGNSKKVKPSVSGVPTDFFEKPAPPPPAAQKPAGLSFLAGVYGEEEEDDDGDGDEEEGQRGNGDASGGAPPGVESASTGLPADFFDNCSIPAAPSVSHSGSISKADEPERTAAEKKGNTAEALPEGFFDDPVRDAKVRNVEAPKDMMDKEWEEFQKEIRQVNTKSDAIVAEDDEEGRFERQIDEIDEQIECYKRVEVLRDRREVVKSKSARENVHVSSMDDENEGDDEEELLHLLSRDWRAKGALA